MTSVLRRQQCLPDGRIEREVLKTELLWCLAEKTDARATYCMVSLYSTMSVEPTSSNSPSVEARGPPTMKYDFISVREALKLVPYFKGNKQEILAFIGNVDTAFSIINLVQEYVLCKFVLTRISGESRTVV